VFSLYFDEDSQQRGLIQALRRVGFDCVTVTEAGMRGQSDESQLSFSTEQSRVLFSSNVRDFRRLDTEWRRAGIRHAGIILLTDQLTLIGVRLRAFEEMGPGSGLRTSKTVSRFS
jgi:hypothetical protein